MTTFGFNLNVKEKKEIAKRIGLPDESLLSNLGIKQYLLAQTNENADEKYKRLRNEKMEADIIYRKLLNEYFKNFHSPPSIRGSKAMFEKSQIESSFQSPFDEANNRIQCNECGQLFGGNIVAQRDKYIDHMLMAHHRIINELEQKVLSGIK